MASPPAKRRELSLDSIDAGIARVEEKVTADARDLLELEGLKTVQLQNKLARSRIKNVKADRAMRKTYAARILRYLEIYSGIVGVLVVISGFKLWGFSLPVEVLAALVGSTAIAAIGLVGFIARGLFGLPQETPTQ